MSSAPLEAQQLRELAKRIIASGVLGRSKTYAAILDYLVECSINGEQPKEMAIAVDVLGRDSDFDVGKDSIVRVHLYHLRNKLETYFGKQGQNEAWRLEIPKGQYLIVTVPNTPDDQPAGGQPETAGQKTGMASPWWPRISAVLALLLVALLVPVLSSLGPDPLQAARESAPWSNMLDDDTPIIVVVGDYFIFGELGEDGSVARMVRDFDINSNADLEAVMMMQPELYDRYYNLGLSYLPVGSANALASVMPLLYDQRGRVSVRTISQLSANDLTDNHIIYLGYISGLGLLEDLVFASSSLHRGATYDELTDPQGNLYLSDSGILNMGGEFHDYGLVSAFNSPRGHQFLLIAGMRDAALISMAEAVSSAQGLARIADETGHADAWEALYEAYGYDHTSFDATLQYAGELDGSVIWGGL